VIIIGAGLAGLAAGCYLRLNGYETHIFEHAASPGGVAASWRRGDYLIDGGIHFIMGHRPGQDTYTLYDELGLLEGQDFVPLREYGRFVDDVLGRELTIGTDLQQTLATLRREFPGEGALLGRVAEAARALARVPLLDVDLARPPELAGRLGSVRQMWHYRHAARYFGGRYSHPVGDVAADAGDPFLRFILPNLFLPEVPLWFVVMLLVLLDQGQVGLLGGGSAAFTGALERRYRGLGGELTCRATVSRILVEGHRAAGVELTDGSRHEAHVVVSAADGYGTIFGLLGGRFAGEGLRNRYRTWQLFRPQLMLSYGVNRSFAGEPSFTMWRSAEPLALPGHTQDTAFVRLFNYSEAFAPPGKTVLQVELETEWAAWHDLRHTDRSAYEAEKQRVAEAVLARLEGRYPGLGAQVEVTDVATPYTTWRYTGNRRGSFEGWLPTPEVLTTICERTLPGLDDFIMAGQWVMPGGGVPPSLYSGRHVAEILCHRDRRPFQVHR